MMYDYIEELEVIEKFNPYHDRLGRFTTAGNAASFTIRTRGGAYQQGMVNRAIEREKQRTGGEKKKTGEKESFKYVNSPEKIATRRQLNEEKKRVRQELDKKYPNANDHRKANSKDPNERQQHLNDFKAWEAEMKNVDKEFRRIENAISASRKAKNGANDTVRNLALLDGVNVNITSNSIEFYGDTFKHKEAFKAIGAKWDGDNWVLGV